MRSSHQEILGGIWVGVVRVKTARNENEKVAGCGAVTPAIRNRFCFGRKGQPSNNLFSLLMFDTGEI